MCGNIQPFTIYWSLPLEISPPMPVQKVKHVIHAVHGEIFICSMHITTKELIKGMSYFTRTYQDITYQDNVKTISIINANWD